MVQSMLSSVRDALYWAPPWLSGVVVLLIAVICALAVHRVIFFMFGRAFGERHPFLRTLVRQSKGPLALALVAFALGAALQSDPFPEAVSAPVGRLLLIAFIVLAGWIAHIAVETGGRIYLHRFTVETADNLLARKHITQVRILKRALHTLIVVVTLSAVLMTFDPVRQYGVSLFASAGVAGLVVGLAARPLLTNLIAGIQIATTQPIRIDDQVVVENESARIEEITSTYVVVRLWDLRRLIVPLTLFIEKAIPELDPRLDQPDQYGVALCRFHRPGRSQAITQTLDQHATNVGGPALFGSLVFRRGRAGCVVRSV
jgi:small-conductance mechanosensitive channel